MNDPTPLPPAPPSSGFAPSNSSNASAAGTFLAVIIAWWLSLKGIFMPAGVEAAFGGILAFIAGYLPKSGRK
jgi:hypothetical protein